jgi:hypothetical protein
MTFHEAFNLGLMTVPAAAICARVLVYFCKEVPEQREEQAATTADQRHAILLERTAQRYRAEGHKDPWQAASDEIGGTIEAARFRAYACGEYVSTGKKLSESRDEWWRSAAPRMTYVNSIGRSKTEALLYVAAVKNMIFQMDGDTVFTTGEAAEKWHTEQTRIADWHNEYERLRRRDPITDSVIDGLWKNMRGGSM